MKIHRDNWPQISTRIEIKTQIAIGALNEKDLFNIIDEYGKSKYYLTEDVLNFLEEYLGIDIHNKNKFYIREEEIDNYYNDDYCDDDYCDDYYYNNDYLW